MELKDSIAIIIASYGALLSTYLAIKAYINSRENLKFIHQYDFKEQNMHIIITNSSTKSIDIISGKYFIGAIKKPEFLNIKLPTTIEAQQSLVVKIDLKNKDKYFEKVDKFIFTSSLKKEFSYQMRSNIREDLSKHLSIEKIEQSFFTFEKISDDVDEIIHNTQKALQEAKIESKKTNDFIVKMEEFLKIEGPDNNDNSSSW